MSLRRFLGLEGATSDAGSANETATVRRIVAALERLEPAEARYVARFAYVLGRVAHADLETSTEETRAMEQIVVRRGLPEEQAILVVQIAKSQNLLFGSTEDYLVTREFARSATRDQKLALLECCFAVSVVDRDVSGVEEAEIRKIASELGLEHADFITARLAHREHLAVLKKPLRR